MVPPDRTMVELRYEDRDLSMEDYRKLSVMAALDAISAILSDRKVHAFGYCIGGTLLTIVAAAMALNGDNQLRSLTLLVTQTDFTDSGELTLFIDESQVTYLKDIMWEKVYLDSRQMSAVSDHVVPWRSVYKFHLLSDTQVTFLHTSGGHNACILSETGHPRRTYQMDTRQEVEFYIDPD